MLFKKVEAMDIMSSTQLELFPDVEKIQFGKNFPGDQIHFKRNQQYIVVPTGHLYMLPSGIPPIMIHTALELPLSAHGLFSYTHETDCPVSFWKDLKKRYPNNIKESQVSVWQMDLRQI